MIAQQEMAGKLKKEIKLRWINIREAEIDPDLRRTFEQYGTVTMQTLLATNATTFRHKGSLTTVQMVEQPLLAWLTDQYDRADRKETWSLTMEVAITIFVLGELIFDFIKVGSVVW